jgi:hypothetical protein
VPQPPRRRGLGQVARFGVLAVLERLDAGQCRLPAQRPAALGHDAGGGHHQVPPLREAGGDGGEGASEVEQPDVVARLHHALAHAGGEERRAQVLDERLFQRRDLVVFQNQPQPEGGRGFIAEQQDGTPRERRGLFQAGL